MSRLVISDLPLSGLKLIERQYIRDRRGFLSRLFCSNELTVAGWQKPIAQINHTHTSQRGTIRGLHFQKPPHTEMKLVTCIKGEVWDVAIDLRKDSKSFLEWHAEILSSKNGHGMLIPEGFAHGFQSLSNDVELLYFHNESYAPQSESGLRFDDKVLNIKWPLTVTEISERDQVQSLITSQFNGIQL